MRDFIKDDLQLASYRYNNNIDRENTSVDYGFIAQDILYTKVGSEIVQLEDKNDLDSNLSYNQNNYVSTIAGALQEEINALQLASIEFSTANSEAIEAKKSEFDTHAQSIAKEHHTNTSRFLYFK